MTRQDEGKIRLLLVDDEVEFLQATGRALGRRGFVVQEAQDGETALMILARQEFDVVVLDVKMPGIDGAAVFHQIRHLLPDLPVIMLTGHGNVQQAFEISRRGVFDYLSKPCEIEQLAKVATRAAQQGRAAAARPPENLAEQQVEVRLLLVDDDEELLESLSTAIARRGVNVSTANSAEEAQERLQHEVFDVLLLDAKMPGLDGLGLLRWLKGAKAEVAVLLLTGNPSVDLAVEGMRSGALDVLVKPQSPDVLASKVRAVGKAQRQRRQEQHERTARKILSERPD